MKWPAGVSSTDPTSSFLLGLSESGYHALLARARGVILLELTNRGVDDHWLISINRGNIEVANRPGPADAVVRLPQELFASATRGCTNLWTAILRGDVAVEGDVHLVRAFQRLLPGPPPETVDPCGPGRSR